MKYLITIVSLIGVMSACKSIKSYNLIGDDCNVCLQNKNVQKFNLNNFEVYKREVFFKHESLQLYKGYDSDSTFKRYEAQFFLVEKETSAERKIIYFSYIPPYKYNNEYYLNQTVFKENRNLVNFHLINYIYFGRLLNNEIIQLNKVKSLSNWKITFNDNQNEICIDKITFKDRGKVKTINPSVYLGNPPIYKKINSPLFVLHTKLEGSISPLNTDYISPCTIYYDNSKKCVYIRFKEYLENPPERLINRWIKFDKSRVRSIIDE